MRLKLALFTMTLAVAATPAGAAAPTAPVKLTIPGTGISCVMTSASVSCQGATSAVTMSATLTPAGLVTTCRQPQGASPGCLLWPGARYKNIFLAQPEPTVGPFACVPVGMWMKATGAVCTVTATGKGFRITAGKVVSVSVNGRGPYPPCTRAALTAALTRGLHKRTLAPSYFTRGWVCAGNYARGDYVDVHGRIGDDIVVLFRAKGRRWQLISRGGATCLNGKLPAPIYIACTVD